VIDKTAATAKKQKAKSVDKVGGAAWGAKPKFYRPQNMTPINSFYR